MEEIEQVLHSTAIHIYWFRAQNTRGESFGIVRNAKKQSGTDTWRTLCKRFHANTMGTRVFGEKADDEIPRP